MQNNTRTLLHLVSIRGLAAWLVVLFHSIALLRSAMPQVPAVTFNFLEHGYLAVDFFFVLSGFIIFINYYGKFGTDFRQNALRFFWNRLSRIYPVHIVMLAAYLLLALAYLYSSASGTLPPADTAGAFWQSVLLVHAWTGGTLAWNVPSWSISAEWFVYLLFPLVAVFFQRRIRGIASHMLAAAVVLATIAVVYAVFDLHSLSAANSGTPLVRALSEFLLGAIAGSLFIHHPVALRRWHRPVAALIGAVGLTIWLADPPNYATVPSLFFLTVLFLSIDTGWLAKLLSNRLLVYVGEISYSTYMVHYFVYDVLKAGWVRDGQPVSMVALLGSFVAVLILSMLMYKFVEIPMQAYLRGGITGNRRSPLRFRR